MSAAARRSKLLLMGKSGSGKTSMRSVIFSNYSAKDTRRLGATIDVDQSTVRFLGSLVLNLWDCGGQNAFVDNYLTAQQSTIFANVAVLIYVFDITSTEWDADLKYFDEILTALRENSGDAGVWVLINKMDLADKEDPQRKKYEERKADVLAVEERIRKERREKRGGAGATGDGASGTTAAAADVNGDVGEGEGGSIRCFATSIWDESLYKAWSSIVHTLIPNIGLITSHLTFVRDLCLSAEIILFETETFLVIAKSGTPVDTDPSDLDAAEQKAGVRVLDRQRFEKISEIVKGFRKTCQRTGEQWLGFESTFDECRVIVEPMTRNSFVLVVSVDPRIETAMLQYNLNMARNHFAEFSQKPVLERKCGLCRGTKELRYEVQGDDDPSVPAWDDCGRNLEGLL